MSDDTESSLCIALEKALVTGIAIGEEKIGVKTAIHYCPLCSLPSEYCEYGGMWKNCQKLREESENFEEIKTEEKTPAKEQYKIVMGVHKRGKHKLVTSVTGLHHFLSIPAAKKKTKTECSNERKEVELKLIEISKELKKLLSCGCSLQDSVLEIQGDVVDRLMIELPKRYGVTYGISTDSLSIGKRERFR